MDDLPLSQKNIPVSMAPVSQRAPGSANLEPLKANISNKFFPNFKNSMDNLIRSSVTETDKQNSAIFFDGLLHDLTMLRTYLPSSLSRDQQNALEDATLYGKRPRPSFGMGTRKNKKRKGSRRKH